MKMAASRIEIGESAIGTESYIIDNITSNAVVVLTKHGEERCAVINLDVSDAPKAEKVLDGLVRKYIAEFENTSPNELEATVVGGHYREHRQVVEGYCVYHEHTLTRKKAEEALQAYEIQPQYLETDILAAKTILVEKGKIILISQKREGFNNESAVMSEDTYYRTVSRDKCCD